MSLIPRFFSHIATGRRPMRKERASAERCCSASSTSAPCPFTDSQLRKEICLCRPVRAHNGRRMRNRPHQKSIEQPNPKRLLGHFKKENRSPTHPTSGSEEDVDPPHQNERITHDPTQARIVRPSSASHLRPNRKRRADEPNNATAMLHPHKRPGIPKGAGQGPLWPPEAKTPTPK